MAYLAASVFLGKGAGRIFKVGRGLNLLMTSLFLKFNSPNMREEASANPLPLTPSQPDFGKVYKVKDENMKKLHCLSFHMVCRLMF